METYSPIGLLRRYGNLQSYWTTTELCQLTVVLDYYGAMSTYSRIGLLRSYVNLQSYWTTAAEYGIVNVFQIWFLGTQVSVKVLCIGWDVTLTSGGNGDKNNLIFPTRNECSLIIFSTRNECSLIIFSTRNECSFVQIFHSKRV